jgi:predicted nicotinamide N-methyase
VRRRRVLELGCGLAPLGHVCTALGAAAVVATDGEASTVALARATAAAKATAAVSSKEAPSAAAAAPGIAFSALRWGDAAAVDALGDGFGGSGIGSFELVLGTELMYYATPVAALVATVAAALRRPLAPPLPSPHRKAPPACALLSHFFRRAELPRELVAACRAHGEMSQGDRKSLRFGVPRVRAIVPVAKAPRVAAFFGFKVTFCVCLSMLGHRARVFGLGAPCGRNRHLPDPTSLLGGRRRSAAAVLRAAAGARPPLVASNSRRGNVRDATKPSLGVAPCISG